MEKQTPPIETLLSRQAGYEIFIGELLNSVREGSVTPEQIERLFLFMKDNQEIIDFEGLPQPNKSAAAHINQLIFGIIAAAFNRHQTNRLNEKTVS